MRSSPLTVVLRVLVTWPLAFLFLWPMTLLCILGYKDLGMSLWCWTVSRALGIRVTVKGETPLPGALVVTNHVSYLDPLIVAAFCPGRFLAKSEIADWPFFGNLAIWSGSIFIERDSARRSFELIDRIAGVMRTGARVVLFPEGGILTDGTSIAQFKPMIFESAVRAGKTVAPAALVYTEPDDPSVWGWSDGSSIADHLLKKILPSSRIGVELRFGEILDPTDGLGRKELAALAQAEVERLQTG